jgi:hypothetical protein
MSQHLTHSRPGCKAFITSSGIQMNIKDLAAIAGPIIPIQDIDDCWSSVESPNKYGNGDFSDPVFNEESSVVEEDYVPGEVATCSPNLQDVVSFPVAFTSSVFHKVQLLKLLHDIGAPNYDFQSFMEWGHNCTQDKYHFQPCPQPYEIRIHNLTELVGMCDCLYCCNNRRHCLF